MYLQVSCQYVHESDIMCTWYKKKNYVNLEPSSCQDCQIIYTSYLSETIVKSYTHHIYLKLSCQQYMIHIMCRYEDMSCVVTKVALSFVCVRDTQLVPHASVSSTL
jgi:hypothetical protein